MEMLKGVASSRKLGASGFEEPKLASTLPPQQDPILPAPATTQQSEEPQRSNSQQSSGNNGSSEPSGQSDDWDSSANEDLQQYQFQDD